jgi:hypothetical protein
MRATWIKRQGISLIEHRFLAFYVQREIAAYYEHEFFLRPQGVEFFAAGAPRLDFGPDRLHPHTVARRKQMVCDAYAPELYRLAFSSAHQNIA